MTSTTLTPHSGFIVRQYDRIIWNDETFTVLAATTQYVILRDEHGTEKVAEPWELAEDHARRFDVAVRDPAEMWMDTAGLSEKVKKAAADWLPHLREIDTGYQSGDPRFAEPHEPRPQYAPGQSQDDKLKAKAAELAADKTWKHACSKDTVYRKLRQYRKAGVRGVAVKQYAPRPKPMSQVKRAVLGVLHDLNRAEKGKSTGWKKRMLVKLRKHVRENSVTLGVTVDDLPSKRTLYRWINELESSRYTFTSAKTNSTQEDEDGTVYVSVRAPAPGHAQIDVSGCDVRLIDHNGEAVSAKVILLFDIYTRLILGYSVVLNAKAVDCTDLLRQAIEPPAHLDGYDEALAFRMKRYPGDRIVSFDERLRGNLSRPPVPLDVITIDNEAVFAGTTFEAACAYLGITIQYARLAKGQDKGVVERGFGTFGSDFAEFVWGYTGGSTDKRGDDVDREAVYTTWQFEELLAEWVFLHNRQPTEAHRTGDLPPVSPIEKYEQYVAGLGIYVPPHDPDIYFHMLNRNECAYNKYGAQVRYLIYNSAEFQSYRRSLDGQRKQKAVIRWDPHDRTRVWWKDPRDNTFKVMWCTDLPDEYIPFGDNIVDAAVKQIASDDRFVKARMIVEYAQAFHERLLDGPETKPVPRRAARAELDRARLADERQAGTPADTLTPTEQDDTFDVEHGEDAVVVALADHIVLNDGPTDTDSAERAVEAVPSDDVLDLFR